MEGHVPERHLVPRGRSDDDLKGVESDEAPIYRSEVLAIIGALSDLVFDVHRIRERLDEDDEEEEGEEGW